MLADGMTYEQIASRYPGNDRNTVYAALRRWRKAKGIETQPKCVHCKCRTRTKTNRDRKGVPVVCADCIKNHKTPMPSTQQIRGYVARGLTPHDIACLHPGNGVGSIFYEVAKIAYLDAGGF